MQQSLISLPRACARSGAVDRLRSRQISTHEQEYQAIYYLSFGKKRPGGIENGRCHGVNLVLAHQVQRHAVSQFRVHPVSQARLFSDRCDLEALRP